MTVVINTCTHSVLQAPSEKINPPQQKLLGHFSADVDIADRRVIACLCSAFVTFFTKIGYSISY